MFVDADAPAVREWAETAYDDYPSESTQLREVTLRGFERAMEDRSGAG